MISQHTNRAGARHVRAKQASMMYRAFANVSAFVWLLLCTKAAMVQVFVYCWCRVYNVTGPSAVFVSLVLVAPCFQ